MALTTATALKEYLGITTPADDGLLARLVVAAESYICAYTHRRAWTTTPLTDEWLGKGNRTRSLHDSPVQSVTTVTVAGEVVPQATNPQAPVGWTLVEDLLLLDGYSYQRGRPCAVAYVAGFADPPPDVAQACLDMAAEKYRTRTRVGQASIVLSGSGEQITFTVQDLHPNVRNLLDDYIRWRPI